ncbi:hypothetical protein HOLleu_41226 [Holothuria leucospilota]|uniref:Core-binding (CB) domain-containing protein n=1 Tax=Holothuria leucospilota TaxID=206669 RepID=A0A9Q1BCI9_HOLLE|nr:hypothetical protein HOLleu_41226 [Holothuria leucospilota]
MESCTIRFINQPVLVLQNNQAGSSVSQITRSAGSSLCRRLPIDGAPQHYGAAQRLIAANFEKTRVDHKFRKVIPHARNDKRVHRVQDFNSRSTNVKDPKYKGSKVEKEFRGRTPKDTRFCTFTSLNSRAMYRYDKGNSARQITFAQLVQTSINKKRLGPNFGNRPSNTTGFGLVEAGSPHLEWRPNYRRPHRYPDPDRRVCKWLGCSHGFRNCGRFLEYKSIQQTLKLQGNAGNSHGIKDIQGPSGQECANSYRQRQRDGIHQSPGGSQQRADTDSQCYLGRGSRQANDSNSEVLGRDTKRNGRPIVPFDGQIRVAPTPKTLCIHRQVMGTPYLRSVCNASKCTIAYLQQSVCRTSDIRGRCLSTNKLGRPQQLCKRAIPLDSTNFESSAKTKGKCYNYSPSMARSAMVSDSKKACYLPASKVAQKGLSSPKNETRTVQESALDNLRLENIWAEFLASEGWSRRASAQMPLCLAPSTLRAYNRVIGNFAVFCNKLNVSFPAKNTGVLAAFLCSLADASQAPRAQLKITCAALGHVYKSYGVYNVINDEHIQLLITALIKSATNKPMSKSNVLPVQPFRDTF